jgi:hypothetical protein
MPIGIKDTGLAIQNSIMVFFMILAIGPIFHIHYIPLFGYLIDILLFISSILSLYLVLCIFLGFFNIVFGKDDGMQIIVNAFIMWLPTLLISGQNNGYVCLTIMLNYILSFISHLISKFLG